MKTLPSIKEYDSLSCNPFLIDSSRNDFVTHYTRPKPKDGYAYIDGVREESIIEVKDELVTRDLTVFVKFFDGSFDIIKNLSNPAMSILCYIVETIKKGNDFVCLPVREVLEHGGYNPGSRVLYYNGVKELLSVEIISPKTSPIKHEYWINPNLFFKGDRVPLFNNQKNKW